MSGNYIESNLLEGEEIVYETHLSSIVFAFPIFLAGIGIIVAVFSRFHSWGILAVCFAGLLAIPQLIAVKTSEFAVTNRRVLIKVGWLRRISLELLLPKVESISVDQSLTGRMFDFGTIGVRGTGGTREAFPNIAQPFEFRRQVQALTDEPAPIPQAPRAVASASAVSMQQCPHCISDIPAAATVCRYCARDVASAPAGDNGQRQLATCNHVWKDGDDGRECKRCGAFAG